MKIILLKAISFGLVIALIFGINTQSYSIEEPPQKQEVVYANLSSEGDVDAVYVVNIVEPDDAGIITDYGRYSDVRNMSSTDEISVDGDKITIKTDEPKLYYEGTLNDTKIPWNFDITYLLDGEKISAKDVVGKSGEVEITIDISHNTEAQATFYENMTLQIAVTLDTDRCSDIKAEGSSVANVGKKKQFMFMILPGSEKTLSISANAQDFEMDAISINAVVAAMNIDVDESGILENVDTLQEAAVKLDDGATDLESGIYELKQGIDEDLIKNLTKLKSGSSEMEAAAALLAGSTGELDLSAAQLVAGAQGLEQGISTLDEGISQICAGLSDLDSQSDGLTQGSAQVYAALLQIQQGLDSIPAMGDVSALATSSTQILTAINGLTSSTGSLKDALSYDSYSAALGTAALKSGNTAAITAANDKVALLSGTPGNEDVIAVLNQAAAALSANNAHIDATEVYFTSLETNAAALYTGMIALQTQYSEFDTGISSVATQLSGLMTSLTALSDSVDALVLQYAGLNDGIVQYTEGVVQASSGCTQAYSGMPELIAASALLTDGLEQLKSATSQLSSATKDLKSATSSFDDGVIELAKGVNDLTDGVDELYDGSKQLKEGTAELSGEAAGMDTTITDQIDDMVGSVSGDSDKIVSFVSEKNTNVTSVQFVIKTQAIKVKQQEQPIAVQVQKKNFWQKLLLLFGIE